ncbi:YqaA family protein [Agrobacterium sp. ES01]|uniref:YqaA family protein n=1 Tax=Agrobacterium sp. ES01 TaxID=3420714 RepID=UPI003D12D5F3
MTSLLTYGGLFLTALAAGSILPMQSEAALAGLITVSGLSAWSLVLVATAGNVAGSIVNWFLGRGVERFSDRKWFPVSEEMLERAKDWYRRYGKWSLLLSWVPVVGDPLTVVAGVLREPLATFVVLVTIAKFVRYMAVAALTLNVIG